MLACLLTDNATQLLISAYQPDIMKNVQHGDKTKNSIIFQDFPESPPSPPRPDLRTTSPRSEGPPNVTIGSELPANEARVTRDTLQRSFSVPATHSSGISEALALSTNSVSSN